MIPLTVITSLQLCAHLDIQFSIIELKHFLLVGYGIPLDELALCVFM